jgi:signal transduction histidine kinase
MVDAGGGAHAGRASGSPRRASVRWALVALVPPVVFFFLSSVYVTRWSRQLDEAILSVSTNGGPSVVYLAAEAEYLRRIAHRVIVARPETVADDRIVIAAWKAHLTTVDNAALLRPEYVGERWAYYVLKADRERFLASTSALLDALDSGRTPPAALYARLSSTADVLADSLNRLIQINSDGLMEAAETIDALRHRTQVLESARDALAFVFVVAGTVLGVRSSRHEAAVAAQRRALDQHRVDELDSFAGRVAHDLRDLLGVIMMRASIGTAARTPEACREALAHVVRASQRMNEIIVALLGFARAGGRPDPEARCDLPEVVARVASDLGPVAAEAGVTLAVEPMRRLVVACDATVLSLVVTNLVRNAVKYIGDAPARRVTIRARAEGARARVEVEDTGPGIPPGAEEHIFEPFVRLPESRRGSGVGLGLATVKRLVEAHGGEVGVASPPGAGARFWFTLRLPEAR